MLCWCGGLGRGGERTFLWIFICNSAANWLNLNFFHKLVLSRKRGVAGKLFWNNFLDFFKILFLISWFRHQEKTVAKETVVDPWWQSEDKERRLSWGLSGGSVLSVLRGILTISWQPAQNKICFLFLTIAHLQLGWRLWTKRNLWGLHQVCGW